MTTRSEAAAGRRVAILEAALALFDQKGIEATSIEEICASSGASNGSLYYHFRSKEGIAATLYTQAIADYQEEVLSLLTRRQDARTGITEMVRHFLRWVEANRALARLMLSVEHVPVRELARNEVERLNQQFLPPVREWFAQHLERGVVRDLPPDVLLCALLGGARRYAELWLEGRARTPLAKAGRMLADHVWSGLALDNG